MKSDILYQVLKRPRVSEKTALLSELHGQYTFEVAGTASKFQIKQAVEHVFNVKVRAVNVLHQLGKRKTFKQRRGKRADIKKAYITLEAGHTIDVGVE